MRARNLALGTLGLYAAYRLLTRARRRISFRDRVVVITGGSRGLGLVIARQLAAEGAKLVLIARDDEELTRALADIEALGASVVAVAADVTDDGEIELAMQWINDRLGPVDVLINCAGSILVGPVEHMTPG